MSKGEETRDRIVSAALVRAISEGLGAVTIGTTATQLSMSKSGLFAHFGSKDALQAAIVERAIDRFRQKVIDPALRLAKPRDRLEAMLEGYGAWMDGDAEIPGCPFVVAVQEFRDRPGDVRDALVRSQRDWRDLLAATIKAGQEDGSIARIDAPPQIAFELIGAILAYQTAKAVLGDDSAPRLVQSATRHILDRG